MPWISFTIHTEKINERMDYLKMDYSNQGDIPVSMTGYDHHKMMIREFRKRFWMSLIITIPILIFSQMIQDFAGYNFLLPDNRYILLALAVEKPYGLSYWFKTGGMP